MKIVSGWTPYSGGTYKRDGDKILYYPLIANGVLSTPIGLNIYDIVKTGMGYYTGKVLQWKSPLEKNLDRILNEI